MSLATYFQQTIEELRQVTWPKPQATAKLTATVIIISLLVAAYVGGLDFLFTNLLTYIIK